MYKRISSDRIGIRLQVQWPQQSPFSQSLTAGQRSGMFCNYVIPTRVYKAGGC